jgi:Ulp1 family protease
MYFLKDDTIDFFAEKYSQSSEIGYVSSINSQAVFSKIQKYGFQYYQAKDIKKELGITGKEKGIQIVIHYKSHWSLVWYWAKDNRLYHYDSLLNHNLERAKYVISTFQVLGAIPFTEKWIQPTHYPLQESGWSCGYFVCACIYVLNDKEEISPISFKDIRDRYCTLFMNEIVMKDTISTLLCIEKTSEPQRWDSSNIFLNSSHIKSNVNTSTSEIVW